MSNQCTTPLTKLRGGHPRLYRGFPVSLTVKNGCFNASDGVILLSGLSVKHLSRRSMKWFRSLDSTSFIPPDAAKRRVRRSRVGLTTARVLTVVCIPVSLNTPEGKASIKMQTRTAGFNRDQDQNRNWRLVESVSLTPSDPG